MQDILGHEEQWYPLKIFGITNAYAGLTPSTIIYTWIAIAALVLLIGVGRYFLLRPATIGGHIVRKVAKSFIELIEQSVGTFVYRYYLFIASLFLFIFACNLIALVPSLEEPTKDLNTTLALGIISFLYAQKEIIKTHGLVTFLKEYFMPFNVIFPLNLIAGIVVLPLKLLGELASIVSISFRLFGNIFGGSIIMSIFRQAVGNSLILNILAMITGLSLLITCFFVLFEGFLQAFVFSILSLTNIAMAVQEENEVSV